MALEGMRLGVVGLGMGLSHAKAILRSGIGQLVCVCDINPELEKNARSLEARFYTDYREMLDESGLDGVVVSLPHDLHAAATVECAKRGIHILMEKPLAHTLEDCDTIINAAKECNIKIMVGYMRRYNAQVQKAREMVADGLLGKMVCVQINFLAKKPDSYFEVKWKRERERGGGPIFMNLSHDIDVMRYICGEVKQVSAHLSNGLRGDSAEDSGTVSMVLENGAVGTILYSDSVVSPSVHNWLIICGTEGCIEIGANLWSRYKPGAREIERIPIPVSNKVDALTEQIKTFAGMIAGTAEPLSTVEDARKTTEVQVAILESDRKGVAVSVKRNS